MEPKHIILKQIRSLKIVVVQISRTNHNLEVVIPTKDILIKDIFRGDTLMVGNLIEDIL
jgi:hypothetical protein